MASLTFGKSHGVTVLNIGVLWAWIWSQIGSESPLPYFLGMPFGELMSLSYASIVPSVICG